MSNRHVNFREKVNTGKERYLLASWLYRKTSLQLALALAGEKLQLMGPEKVSSAERSKNLLRLNRCYSAVGMADKQQLPDFNVRMFFDYNQESVSELDARFVGDVGKRFQNASAVVAIPWGEVEEHFAPYLKKRGEVLPIGLRLFYDAYQQLKKE